LHFRFEAAAACFDLPRTQHWMIIMMSLSMKKRRPISDSSTAC
jgi:hypothetical protein